MFSFQEQSLDTGTFLYMGPLGPVYPYYQDPDDNRWAVEVITTTNQQLINYIEDIILRFTYLDDIAPMEGFYIKPIEVKAGNVNEWEIYIKVPRENESPNFDNIQIHQRATFEFEAEKLNDQNRLGKGGFGSIYPYEEGLTNDEWVVKVMSVSNSELSRVIDEILIGFSCKHPNVLSIKGFHMEPVGGSYENVENWDVYIKMPRMKENLKEKLERHRRSGPSMSIEEGKKCIFQIIAGLKYLHERGIAHRDLKPGNILLDYKGNALIADMGQANLTAGESELTANNRAGTKSYRAPELEGEKKLVKKDLLKADIWSLGLIIAEICFINTDVEGTDEEKAGELIKCIEHRIEEDKDLERRLDLFDFNPEKNHGTKTIEQIETIITDEEMMGKLKDQAIEFGHLEFFSKEAKWAKDYFNDCYSHSILNELAYINFFYKGIFSCDPEERPPIQELDFAVNCQKAFDLVQGEIKKLDLSDVFYKKMDLDDSDKVSLSTKFREEILEELEQGREINLLSLNERMKAEAKEAIKKLKEKEERARLKKERQMLTTLIMSLEGKFGDWFYFEGDEIEQSLEIAVEIKRAIPVSTGRNKKDKKEARKVVKEEIIKPVKMDNKLIRALFQSLHTKNAKNLRTLKISFPKSFEDLQEGIFANILETELPNMYPLNIQKISINLVRQKMGVEDYKGLFAYLGAYHKNMTSLHLSFDECYGFKDNSVRYLGLLIESQLNCLKNIDFNFMQENLKDDMAIDLLQKIGLKGKNLTSLRLNLFYCPQLSQATNIQLANQLENFKNLFHLKLEMSSFGEEASRYLFEKLGNLESLQILKLDLWDEDGLRMIDATEVLATSIGAHLQKLQILSLVFNKATKMTDKSAQQLINSIGSNLTRLRNFTLKFIGSEKIGDGAIRELQNQIKAKNLLCPRLDLSFQKCFKISSQAIQDFVQQIAAEEEPYSYLGLDFNGCLLLDDAICIKIAALLGKSLITQRLYLDLSDLKLEEKTQKSIKRLLKHIFTTRIKLE